MSTKIFSLSALCMYCGNFGIHFLITPFLFIFVSGACPPTGAPSLWCHNPSCGQLRPQHWRHRQSGGHCSRHFQEFTGNSPFILLALFFYLLWFQNLMNANLYQYCHYTFCFQSCTDDKVFRFKRAVEYYSAASRPLSFAPHFGKCLSLCLGSILPCIQNILYTVHLSKKYKKREVLVWDFSMEVCGRNTSGLRVSRFITWFFFFIYFF